MDPNYLKYLGSMGIDPSHFIEMQANYLRLLANCYSNNERPASASSVNSSNFSVQAAKPAVQEKLKMQESESLDQSLQEESIVFKRSANLHDEMPVKSLSMPFEKLLEEEIKKSSKADSLNSSNSKHSFLKRKSQNILPKKETTPNTSSPKSQFSAFLNPDSDRPKPEPSQKTEKSLKTSKKSSKFQEKSEFDDFDEKTQKEDLKIPEKPKKSIRNSFDPNKSESPKPRQEFLKRGEGKLCTQKRSASLARLDKKKPRFKEDERVDEDFNEDSSEQEVRESIPEIKDKNYLKYKKLSKELEEKKQKLEKDALDFYKMRENEVKSLELWKNDEMKKINEERKKIEKHGLQKPADVFELENLKREIKQLRTTLTKNEDKYNKTIESLKEIIETLTTRNQELQKILQEKTFEMIETDEKPSKSTSEISVKLKPSRIPSRLVKEETPKFKKQESLKNPPTFTFKLPEKKSEDTSSILSAASNDSPPIIEIKLEELKSNKIQEIIEENKTQKIFDDGKREILFSNGVRKEIFPDGYMIVHFNNKDRKETFPDGKIIYHFFENQTTQTTFPDGLQLFQFANGQTEKHFSDGTKEIKFPDGTIKCIFTDGEEESIFPDGTVQKVDKLGVRVIEFANGMKDTVMPDGSKIRVYPDGKIKKTSQDGKVVE